MCGKKAVSKLLGIWTFFLFFLLQEAFPKAAFAFTSLNSCFKDRACAELLAGTAAAHVAVPTSAGSGASNPISVIGPNGVAKTSVNGVTDFAMVVAPSPGYVIFQYWDRVTNGQAQNKAREKYCAAYPNDFQVCSQGGAMLGWWIPWSHSTSGYPAHGYGGFHVGVLDLIRVTNSKIKLAILVGVVLTLVNR